MVSSARICVNRYTSCRERRAGGILILEREPPGASVNPSNSNLLLLFLLGLSACVPKGLSSLAVDSGSRSPASAPDLNVTGSSSDGTLLLGALLTEIAADGTTVIHATLNDSSGALWGGSPLEVRFSSPCASAGHADLEAVASTVDGIATATYFPHGCTGLDPVNARVTLGSRELSSIVGITVNASPALSAKAALGKLAFFDKNLSGSNQQSCASCHTPNRAYYQPDSLSTPLGGITLSAIGFRSTPSAAYSALIPPFRYLPVTNQQGSVNNTTNGKLGDPRSGLMWDGRARDVAAQASGPFTGPHEMANASNQEVLSRLLSRPYLSQFIAVYGNTTASSNADTVVGNLADAIAAYETQNQSFAPFTSKFDAIQRGRASYSVQEANGFALFTNPRKAACIGCHDSTGQSINDPQLFSDFSYRAIGVPRNYQLPYNDNALVATRLQSLGLQSLLTNVSTAAPGAPALFYDLGYCGPFRSDHFTDSPEYCGAFRVAPLRNIALKGAYFHNGVFGSLTEVIQFYLNRDQNPSLVYKKADGTPDAHFNDLPVAFQANVDQARAPFAPLGSGLARLNADEVKDLISFLCTLTDGYDPAHPETYRLPRQCRNARR